MKFNIRLLYLYLFSFVGLLITIIGSVQLIDLGLKTYVFKVSEYTYYSDPIEEKTKISAEEMEKRNKQEQSNQQKRQLSTSLSMILIGVPLYLYHWKTIKKEN